MNFGSLLYAAQNNTGSKSKETRCYKTTFEPPKKDAKPKTLSANVQKFLQKQEEEKRRKEIEAKKRREELLTLRSQDKMSQKRMNVMLKRTKSANKSVMEDAIDDVNTSVTMNGPKQCDEDDYGYVSQEASSFYNKMMEKYTSMPSDVPSFLKPKKGTAKDLSAAKERVKAALNRVEEEEMLPRKRKRKTKEGEGGEKGEDDFIDDNSLNYSRGEDDKDKEKEREREKEKPKKPKRPPMPPPMDFQALLKLAEQKQHEPIVIDKKKRKRDSDEDDDDDEEDEEEERGKLMTKRQRLEYAREKEERMQRERRRMEEAMRSKSGGDKRQPTGKERPDKSRERERSLERDANKRERPDKDRERVKSRSPPRSSTTLKGGGSFKIPKSNDSRPSSESSPKIPKLSDNTNKPSLDNKKRLPSSVVEEKLKKSSDVWSKPCNLSPSSNKLQSRTATVPTSSKKPLEDRLNELMQEIRSVKQASTKLDLEDKLDMLSKELDQIKRERVRLDNDEKVVKKVENHKSNGSLDRRKEGDERKSLKPQKTSDENCEKRKSTSKPSSDGERRKSDVPRSSSTSNSSGCSSKRPDVSDRLKDDRSSKLNGKSAPVTSRTSSPATKSVKLKSVDLFGEDFPESSDSSDPRKSNGDYNKPSLSAGKQSSSKPPSLAKAAEVAGKQRDLKNAVSQKSAATKGPVGSKSGSSGASSSSIQSRRFPPDDLKPRPGERPKPSSNQVKSRQFPPADVRPRQFPPPDVRSRQFPPNDVRRRRPSPPRSSRYYDDEDDEDEYDSEMDDFIDYGDGDEDEEHVSEIISEIFKYNPSQFSIGDDDDECMESNFGQIDKEEIRSLHFGLKEDLEDIRREQAEKKEAQRRRLQKLAAMKRNKR